MSTKTNKHEKKLPPMETVITRHKASQLKWHLRNKDASRKKISQMTRLLSSPKSQAKSPKKKPVTKKEGRKSISEAKEYYPDKLKRKIEAKKVVLKPKQELKVIAVGSKRKGVPLKGIKSPPPKRSKPNSTPKSLQSILIKPIKLTNEIQNQMSIEEMVRMSDSEILNDEDLLEILTCESPVWWEDPPDEGYCEEPICSRRVTKPMKEKNPEKISISKSSESTQKVSKTKQIDEKFLKKKTKLENLLGNIKTKLDTPRNNLKLNDIKRNINLNESNLHSMENNVSSCNKSDNIETKDEDNAKEISQTNKIKEKRLSESTEGDDPFTHLRDDDILRELENMDIPIEPSVSAKSSDDCIIIDKPGTSKSNIEEVDIDAKINNKMKIRREYLNILKKKNVLIDNIENVDAKVESIEIKAPEYLPNFTITSIEKEAFSSPTSQSISEDTLDTISTVSQDNMDSISDTNIHFIEEDNSNCKSSAEINNEKPEEYGKDVNTTMNSTSSKPIDKIIKTNIKVNGIIQKDCLTVYKIITKGNIDLNVIKKDSNKINEEKIKNLMEKSETADGKLNSFYKKCKITYQRKPNVKKLIRISVATAEEKPKESDKQKTKTKGESEQAETKVKENKQETEIKEHKQETEVKENRQETEVKENKQETEVKENKQETEVKQNKQETEVKENKQETEVKQNKQETEVKQNKQETEVKENKQETEVKENKQETDVKETKQQENEKCDIEKKSMVVSNRDSVKYCFKCSSIFDTDNCAYCVRKSIIINVPERKSGTKMPVERRSPIQ